MVYWLVTGCPWLMRSFAMPDERIYTVEEVAAALSVHPETVRNWIKSGQLRAMKLGGAAGYRITQSAFDEFQREREEAARRQD